MASITLGLDPVDSSTVTLGIDRILHGSLVPVSVVSGTNVQVGFGQQIVWLEFNPIIGDSDSTVRNFPDLGNNTPILLAFSAAMQLDPVEPLESE
jgi:hypothetical protein